MASPGGVGDGLPSLPSGEPVLARWFVVAMLVLFVAAVGITVWAFVAFGGRADFTAAERRPPGTATVTHERGTAVLNATREYEDATGCAQGLELFGDAGARATTDRALSATCQLLASGDFPEAEAGLEVLRQGDGLVRIATFEFTGTESSTRLEDDRIVLELSPRFQFANATRGAPFVLHELVHLGATWPGSPVTADQEVAATQVVQRACDRLALGDDPPLGCVDAATILALADPLAAFVDAGYLRGPTSPAPEPQTDGTDG